MSSSSGIDTVETQVNTWPRQSLIMEARVADVTPTTSPSIHLQIPPFRPEKPAVWFAQIEGQFTIMQITDDAAKFYHVLANLDNQYAALVQDILTGPPDYELLKSELIKRVFVSRVNEVKQLLMHEQLGSRTPSQLLRRLQHLAGPDIPEDFLKTIWTRRLPTSIQPIVASQPTLSLDVLADLADRVNDIATPAQQVTVVPSSPIEALARQLTELTRQVSALTTQARYRRQGQRNRSTLRRTQSSYRRYPICWYHSKYGIKANKCVKPCDFEVEKQPVASSSRFV